ncbi:DNA-binding protein [Pseudoxanthomonas winnipegensis]|uniref:DNA-binding protein n=1 Tax=Pseudoxanthomonas winnipegensis TaxID=2480810 RepID=A0ABY1WCY1_9GAMM|nr:helix-turn-helix domain-containing protein [Pseudoxanthomonas winnipegensis]TAA12421.1 DNA-binding protein [Pseudoxanthomonas winnipegensis]TAA19213.1 DNA-binding protein [Pseudoxanthomonas winnipegensis]TAH70474.1 DNA-binding protein [Pseudoxanthomonas winnipegensis]
MKLIAARDWVQKYFAEESRPCDITVQRWMRSGKVPGRKIGGAWYVDEHAWLANGDELVARVLQTG